MFSTTSSSFGMPAHRFTALAATVTATALALAAAPASATGTATGSGSGRADATVLRTGLDVSLLGKAAHVPVEAVLNDVKAPADASNDASKTALSVTLDGIEGGEAVDILRADAATARATADRRAAKGYANLAHAKVRLPGLPLRSLVEIQQVTSEAVCEAGAKPKATANLLGSVSVLGKKVTLTPNGPTKVTVPGVGDVRLDLSKTVTTSRTAAATALDLDVSVDPLALGVAKVVGKVTLVRASCESPADRPSDPVKPGDGPGAPAKSGTGTEAKQAAAGRTGEPAGQDLAETGGGSATPYLAAAAGLLVVGGGGALIAARRRKENGRESEG
ncbi:SCO1860 family LAETG-anchored protein [Streptomyces sp. NPDC001678]|uniref:SCO1860 family LAETG-anchored protein n=1 Tax=Streptomyces sp. NPDC001678 TaxID=3364599 RepID=UPI0036BA5E6F